MPKRNSTWPTVINAAIFLAMEIVALNMIAAGPSLQGLRISEAAHRFMGTVWGGTEAVKDYFSLRETNDSLMRENMLLHEKLLRYAAADSLADKAAETEGDFTFTPAKILKISNNKQHNFLIINRGSEDGITGQSGIISDKGVVGIIDAVGKRHSYALSLLNSGISISSRIGMEGAVGPLVWDGEHSDGALLKEIPLQYKYSPGDTVYTSGYSSIFPPDIPLGVAGEARIINGATNEIRIRLFQDFSTLRYVTVVTNNGRGAMEELIP